MISSKLFKHSLTIFLSLALGVSYANSQVTHTVKRGETIYGIAHQYNTTPEKIVELNPHANKGVKKNMVLVIPDGNASAPVQQTQGGNNPKPQADSSKSSQQNTDVAINNADAKTSKIADNVDANANIKSDTATDSNMPASKMISYMSQEGDTFDSISQKFGVSVDKLIELNPFVDPIRIWPNTQIRLSEEAPLDIYADYARRKRFGNESEQTMPQAPDQTSPADSPDDIDQTADTDTSDISDLEIDTSAWTINEQSVTEPSDRRNIMLLLPFMADNEKQSKRAARFADFYRGFLIAAQERSEQGRYDVDILTLDTAGDLNRIKQQIGNTTDRDIAVVIAPDEEELQTVIDCATPQEIYVLNVFDFKDENYKTNPYVLQGNINQSLMYDKAITAFMDKFDGYTPVFLNPKNGRQEKEPFTNALKQRLDEAGIESIELPYGELLTHADLANLDPEMNYVFIPKSGALNVFGSFAPALIEYKNSSDNPERVCLFGYPDWTMFRGEQLDHLRRLNAVIYSRFNNNIDRPDLKSLQDAYTYWFGKNMTDEMPSQGTLGYDVANFLLEVLQNNGIDMMLDNSQIYSGIQSTFRFGHEEDSAGYINNALYIITYLPDSTFSVRVL